MSSPAFKVTIITTGGTIEKTFDKARGRLHNQENVLDVMLEKLELPGMEISRVSLMNKDSLEMTAEDHQQIVKAVEAAGVDSDAILVVHGTDRLAETGEYLCEAFGQKATLPVILTGAMRPYELRRTDSMQNLTEALLAARLLEPGVWCVMHNRALRFPGVRKDRERMTFVEESGA